MEGGVVQVGSPTIKPINKGVVHRICSGQVILDLSSAVKELVENSLDAGATSIEIALKDYGEESFKVIDNGCGISSNNFKVLALKHHTSKMADFPDLQSLATFGFRGEALSSLCALGNLTVETRTKSEPIATHLTFDRSGLLTCEKNTARQIGTTVTVEKLFSCLPVRSKEFSRNIRKEYGKLISLLNAYALIAKGVRFVCTNTTGKNAKSVVLNTQGSNSIKDNIITVFGMKTFTCLEPLSVCVSESCMIEGYLSKPGHGSGRNLGDRQFFFVNGRPVDMPKVSKVVNELYKGSNSRQYPIAIMNFTVPTQAYDVNVTPDKRKIFFSDEGSLMCSLKEAIEKIYSPNHCSYSANKIEEPKEKGASQLSICQEVLHVPLRQSSSDGCDNKEAMCVEERTAVERAEEDDVPTAKVKKHRLQTCASEGMIHSEDKNPIQKDFSLKVHTVEKVDSSFRYQSKQVRTPTSIVSVDKYVQSPSSAVERHGSGDIHKSRGSGIVQSSLTKFVTVNKRKHDDSCTVLSEVPVLRNEMARSQVRKTSSEMVAAVSRSIVDHPQIDESSNGNDEDCSVLSEVPVLKNKMAQVTKINSGMVAAVSRSIVDHNQIDESSNGNEEDPSKSSREVHVSNEVETSLSAGGNIRDGSSEEDDLAPEKSLPITDATSDALTGKDLESIPQVLSCTDPCKVTLDNPVPSSGSELCSVLQFRMDDLRMSRQKRLAILRSNGFTCEKRKIKRSYTAATLELSQPENEDKKAKALAAATTELERFFDKKDFGRMKVIGQFNLGFIIARIDQDLFIIDQHAADEKYNFEHLSQFTILNQQPLLQPMRLELSPEEEIVASMHMDIIRKNGFTLVEDTHAPPGQHFKLRAVPFSKNITFGAEDVKELISTLADSQGECTIMSSYKMDTTDSICPSRVRAMLASRACRSSVMIGDALGKNEMEKILRHLAQLKSPWNCPHGRPTMRHLIDLTTMSNNEQDL